MTVSEWYNFNKDIICSDFVVKVLERGSRSNSDIILDSTLVSRNALIKIFGNYEILKFSMGVTERPSGNGYTFKMALWPPVNESED